jgi:hypothetical protein
VNNKYIAKGTTKAIPITLNNKPQTQSIAKIDIIPSSFPPKNSSMHLS